MAATAEQIAQLRRMVDEPGEETYNDALLASYIERYPCLDERGEVPYTWDTSTSPPTQVANDGWIPTYDLAAAAADIWAEKAAGLAQDYKFSADGGTYERQQAYEQAMAQSRYWRARRRASTARLVMSPDPGGGELDWIANS